MAAGVIGPVTIFWCGPRTGHYILVYASDRSLHSGVGLGPVTTFSCWPRTGHYILSCELLV
ncbi:hypothetical protein DPMN_148187 [Dreissena polymorpha]|uniref:Uncharacterized protein n=1 Tax=Dreissena polymorpha TaxID=45954 RepID=A0A9D4F9A9_DREPO|nr:hypothetical protein DPMN_148187 [Dreissena polymorpha]